MGGQPQKVSNDEQHRRRKVVHLGNIEDVDIAGLDGGHCVSKCFHYDDELVSAQWPAWQHTSLLPHSINSHMPGIFPCSKLHAHVRQWHPQK